MNALAILTALVFVCLSAFHVYWSAGGTRGREAVLPTRDGRRLLNPSPLASVLVALALFAAAALAIGATGALRSLAPAWSIRAGLAAVSAVFLLRAVGDFRLVGLFKRVVDTEFARLDSRLFVPLCVGLSASCAALAWSVAE